MLKIIQSFVQYFDPNRRFLKANSLDREQPNGDEFGDELCKFSLISNLPKLFLRRKLLKYSNHIVADQRFD